jgi:hypothetical protein
MAAPGVDVADPWIALAAVAVATERLRLGRSSRRCRAGARGTSRARPRRSTASRAGAPC